MKKFIYKPIAIILLQAFLLQDIAWADPSIAAKNNYAQNLQVPSTFQKIDLQSSELKLIAQLRGVILSKPNIRVDLSPTVDGIPLEIFFSRRVDRGSTISVPCTLTYKGERIEYEAVIDTSNKNDIFISIDPASKKEERIDRAQEIDNDAGSYRQIGRELTITHISTRDNKVKAQDNEGNIHIFPIYRAENINANALKDFVSGYAHKSTAQRELSFSLFDAITETRRILYTFDAEFKDLFGFASPPHNIIALHESIANDPVAIFHELAESAIEEGWLSFKLHKTSLDIMIKGKTTRLKLGPRALAIARKSAEAGNDVLRSHYLLRAVQAQLFDIDDQDLSSKIRILRECNEIDVARESADNFVWVTQYKSIPGALRQLSWPAIKRALLRPNSEPDQKKLDALNTSIDRIKELIENRAPPSILDNNVPIIFTHLNQLLSDEELHALYDKDIPHFDDLPKSRLLPDASYTEIARAIIREDPAKFVHMLSAYHRAVRSSDSADPESILYSFFINATRQDRASMAIKIMDSINRGAEGVEIGSHFFTIFTAVSDSFPSHVGLLKDRKIFREMYRNALEPFLDGLDAYDPEMYKEVSEMMEGDGFDDDGPEGEFKQIDFMSNDAISAINYNPGPEMVKEAIIVAREAVDEIFPDKYALTDAEMNALNFLVNKVPKDKGHTRDRRRQIHRYMLCLIESKIRDNAADSRKLMSRTLSSLDRNANFKTDDIDKILEFLLRYSNLSRALKEKVAQNALPQLDKWWEGADHKKLFLSSEHFAMLNRIISDTVVEQFSSSAVSLSSAQKSALKTDIEKRPELWNKENFFETMAIYHSFQSDIGKVRVEEFLMQLVRSGSSPGRFANIPKYSWNDRSASKWMRKELINKIRTGTRSEIPIPSHGEGLREIYRGIKEDICVHAGIDPQGSVKDLVERIRSHGKARKVDPEEIEKISDTLTDVLSSLDAGSEISRDKIRQWRDNIYPRSSGNPPAWFNSIPEWREILVNLDQIAGVQTIDYSNISHLYFEITDDPFAMLKSAIEPFHTCQRLTEPTEHNNDGKPINRASQGQFFLARIIAVQKDGTEVMVSRTHLEIAKSVPITGRRNAPPARTLLVEKVYQNGLVPRRIMQDRILAWVSDDTWIDNVIFANTDVVMPPKATERMQISFIPSKGDIYRDTFSERDFRSLNMKAYRERIKLTEKDISADAEAALVSAKEYVNNTFEPDVIESPKPEQPGDSNAMPHIPPGLKMIITTSILAASSSLFAIDNTSLMIASSFPAYAIGVITGIAMIGILAYKFWPVNKHGKLNLNSASEAELLTLLKGLTQDEKEQARVAKIIIELREKHPLRGSDDLKGVSKQLKKDLADKADFGRTPKEDRKRTLIAGGAMVLTMLAAGLAAKLSLPAPSKEISKISPPSKRIDPDTEVARDILLKVLGESENFKYEISAMSLPGSLGLSIDDVRTGVNAFIGMVNNNDINILRIPSMPIFGIDNERGKILMAYPVVKEDILFGDLMMLHECIHLVPSRRKEQEESVRTQEMLEKQLIPYFDQETVKNTERKYGNKLSPAEVFSAGGWHTDAMRNLEIARLAKELIRNRWISELQANYVMIAATQARAEREGLSLDNYLRNRLAIYARLRGLDLETYLTHGLSGKIKNASSLENIFGTQYTFAKDFKKDRVTPEFEMKVLESIVLGTMDKDFAHLLMDLGVCAFNPSLGREALEKKFDEGVDSNSLYKWALENILHETPQIIPKENTKQEASPDMAEHSRPHVERNKALQSEIMNGNVFRVNRIGVSPEIYRSDPVQGTVNKKPSFFDSALLKLRLLSAARNVKGSVYERLKRIRSPGGALEKAAQARIIQPSLLKATGMHPNELRAALTIAAQAADILIVNNRFTIHDNGPIAHAKRGVSSDDTAIWLGQKLFTAEDVTDEIIANLILEEALHILAPDADHTVIIHPKSLFQKLIATAKKMGEKADGKFCEADMASDDDTANDRFLRMANEIDDISGLEADKNMLRSVLGGGKPMAYFFMSADKQKAEAWLKDHGDILKRMGISAIIRGSDIIEDMSGKDISGASDGIMMVYNYKAVIKELYDHFEALQNNAETATLFRSQGIKRKEHLGGADVDELAAALIRTGNTEYAMIKGVMLGYGNNSTQDGRGDNIGRSTIADLLKNSGVNDTGWVVYPGMLMRKDATPQEALSIAKRDRAGLDAFNKMIEIASTFLIIGIIVFGGYFIQDHLRAAMLLTLFAGMLTWFIVPEGLNLEEARQPATSPAECLKAIFYDSALRPKTDISEADLIKTRKNADAEAVLLPDDIKDALKILKISGILVKGTRPHTYRLRPELVGLQSQVIEEICEIELDGVKWLRRYETPQYRLAALKDAVNAVIVKGAVTEKWGLKEGPHGSIMAELTLLRDGKPMASANAKISREGIKVYSCGIWRDYKSPKTSENIDLQLIRRLFSGAMRIGRAASMEPQWAFVWASLGSEEDEADVKEVDKALRHMGFAARSTGAGTVSRNPKDKSLRSLLTNTIDPSSPGLYRYWFMPLEELVSSSAGKFPIKGSAALDDEVWGGVLQQLRDIHHDNTPDEDQATQAGFLPLLAAGSDSQPVLYMLLGTVTGISAIVILANVAAFLKVWYAKAILHLFMRLLAKGKITTIQENMKWYEKLLTRNIIFGDDEYLSIRIVSGIRVFGKKVSGNIITTTKASTFRSGFKVSYLYFPFILWVKMIDHLNDDSPDMAARSVLHMERNDALRKEIRAGNVFRVNKDGVAPEIYKTNDALRGAADGKISVFQTAVIKIATLSTIRKIRNTVYERLKRIRAPDGALWDAAGTLKIEDGLLKASGSSPNELRVKLYKIAQDIDILIAKDRFTLHENGPIAHAKRGVSSNDTAIWLGERLFTCEGITDRDIANLLLEEAKHIIIPDAGHSTIIHSQYLRDKLIKASFRLGEAPAEKFCEADMAAHDPALRKETIARIKAAYRSIDSGEAREVLLGDVSCLVSMGHGHLRRMFPIPDGGAIRIFQPIGSGYGLRSIKMKITKDDTGRIVLVFNYTKTNDKNGEARLIWVGKKFLTPKKIAIDKIKAAYTAIDNGVAEVDIGDISCLVNMKSGVYRWGLPSPDGGTASPRINNWVGVGRDLVVLRLKIGKDEAGRKAFFLYYERKDGKIGTRRSVLVNRKPEEPLIPWEVKEILNAREDDTPREAPLTESHLSVPSVKYSFDRSFIQLCLYEIISRLQPRDRRIIGLFLDGYSYPEIALIFNYTRAWAHAKVMYNIVKKLKRMFRIDQENVKKYVTKKYRVKKPGTKKYGKASHAMARRPRTIPVAKSEASSAQKKESGSLDTPKLKQKKAADMIFGDIRKPEDAVNSMIGAMISVQLSGKRLILAFHKDISGSGSQKLLPILKKLEALKNKQGLDKLLKNMVIVRSYASKSDLATKLADNGVDMEDALNNAIFVFAPGPEGDSASGQAVRSVLINDKGFDQHIYYYPLFEIVTVSLIKYLKNYDEDSIRGLLKDLGTWQEEINIGDVTTAGPAYLVFTLIPKAERYKAGSVSDRYALISKAIDTQA